MAGLGLVGIKRRIKSVTNTRKITKAMGLVATSKLRKTKESLETNNSYSDSLIEILKDVVNNYEAENAYIDGNGSKKKLFIVLTSDSGLCGAFNVNILNKAVEEIKKDAENSMIMVIGEKGISYFERFNYELRLKYTGMADVPTLKDAKQFAAAALKMYESGEVGEINVVYTQFISQSNQEIRVENVLPLGGNSSPNNFSDKYVKFEPEMNMLLRDIMPLYLRGKMLNYLIHSKTSEQAIKMAAMDGATKNANELLDKLKIEYNRIRQGAITQEITEIVGGAEAQQ